MVAGGARHPSRTRPFARSRRTCPAGSSGGTHFTERTERLGKATCVRAGERARPHQQGVHRPLQRARIRREEPLVLAGRCVRGSGPTQGAARGSGPRPAARGTAARQEGGGQEGRARRDEAGCGSSCSARAHRARTRTCCCPGTRRRGARCRAGTGAHRDARACSPVRGRADGTGRSGPRRTDQEGHLLEADQRAPSAPTRRRAARRGCSRRSPGGSAARGHGTSSAAGAPGTRRTGPRASGATCGR